MVRTNHSGDGPDKMQSILSGRGRPLSTGENRQWTRG